MIDGPEDDPPGTGDAPAEVEQPDSSPDTEQPDAQPTPGAADDSAD